MNYTSTNSEIITTFGELEELRASNRPGIFLVKPRVILRRLEELFERPLDLSMTFPSSEIGSITLLEGAALVGLMHILKAKHVFEFGTFLGYTTALLAKNLPDAGKVYSLDLEVTEEEIEKYSKLSQEEVLSSDVDNDNFLRMTQAMKKERYVKALPSQARSKVTLLKSDSMKFDPRSADLENSVELVFVDGGHTRDIIANDTQKSELMLSPSGIVAWHDFNSNIHSQVTDFILERAKSNTIFHVQSTMIAFQVYGKL
jgi:predicted O-methyltransferase YrrM